ncbi:MAG: rRNA maturation RNase YbeY [Chloroflexi bacterium]|nr:rRNA maturation RNase YbeY [Chloroflexota bacterium]
MIFLELETRPDFSDALLEEAARATLNLSAAPESDLTLVLTNDEAIRALNRDFLGTDAPTDVLSFPADEADPETGRRYLGDVVISLPRATEQAAARGHAVEAEVQLLVVHGVLHLIGHDHAEADEKTRMWAAQANVLDKLGVKIEVLEE